MAPQVWQSALFETGLAVTVGYVIGQFQRVGMVMRGYIEMPESTSLWPYTYAVVSVSFT